MKSYRKTKNLFKVINLLFTWITITSARSLAQIIPDNTLPNNSQVVQQGEINRIEGGTVGKSNLYHSFKEFSLKTGSTAYFNNPDFIKVILTRITGSNVSTIDGSIKNNGATLFFINPNGIIFGPNTKLEIGGSLIASSAKRIMFPDGFHFGIDSPYNNNFSDKYPNGLDFGPNPGAIRVQGSGNSLFFANPNAPIGSPILEPKGEQPNFSVPSGSLLGLIGGDVSFEGGVIAAPSGAIEIGSVGTQGIVNFEQVSGKLAFDYSKIPSFRNVQLIGRSLIEASGIFNGGIHIQSNNLNISDRSLILDSNFGSQQQDSIKIDAFGSVLIDSLTPENFLLQITPQGKFNGIPFGGIYTQNFSNGESAKIDITAQNLTLKNFSALDSFNFGSGKGGDIYGKIENDLSIFGEPPIKNAFLPSSISSFTIKGKAGNIYLTGKNLSLFDGALSLSQTFGEGRTGNVSYNFSNDIYIDGAFSVDSSLKNFISSTLGVVSTLLGDEGNVSITSNNLYLQNGGKISSTSNGIGEAGDITIFTRGLLKVSGQSPGSTDVFNRSRIISSVERTNSFLGQIFKTSENLSGKAGNISILADRLEINEGLIGVSNNGEQEGGNIQALANDIKLNNGLILANSINNSGGSITLTARNQILLLNKSSISTSSEGVGGNITANSALFVGDSSSGLSANSINNFGGKITVNSPARAISPEFTITATSALGSSFNGTILFNTFANDPTNYITPISSKITPPNPLKPCDPQNPSPGVDFIGAGGFPQSADETADVSLNWQQKPIQTSQISTDPKSGEKIHWVEPGAIVKNPNGTVSFVVNAPGADQKLSSNTCLQADVSQPFKPQN
jgi:filamentous hemagglutinin family protein